jgi:diguanylate cyclase
MPDWFLPVSDVCTLVTLNYIAMKLRSKAIVEAYEMAIVPVLTGIACIIMMLQPLPPTLGIVDLRFAPLVMAGLSSGPAIALLSTVLPAAYSFGFGEPHALKLLFQDLLAPAVLSSLFHQRDYRTGLIAIRFSDGFKTLLMFFLIHELIGLYAEPKRLTESAVLSELYMLLLCAVAIVILIRMINDENRTWLLQRRLELQANQDGLTRLANLRSFMQLAEDTLMRRRVAIFMIDIDNFKLYNDRFGHLAGDDLLREVGRLLRNCIDARDYVARYGGEEFILLSHLTNGEALTDYAAMLCETVAELAGSDREEETGTLAPAGQVTISVGISIANAPGDSLQRIIAEADQALYVSKRNGKNRFTFHALESYVQAQQNNA